MTLDPAYYNVVDQAFHADWTIQKLTRQELLRRSVAELWPEGHPTRLVQVAGTSGKGSTARFLEAALGLDAPTGAYLNPHVFDYRERFSIGGEPPPITAVADAWEDVVLPHCVRLSADTGVVHTFAETGILLALALFGAHEVGWAAMETGLGGRYAQLTGLPVDAAMLTNVGDDHPVSLGPERWQRALDKAGVAREGVPLFTSEADPEILRWIESVAVRAGAELAVVSDDEVAAVRDMVAELPGLAPGALLANPVQHRNAALALAAAKFLTPQVVFGAAVEAMAGVALIGRWHEAAPGVYADIAHNPDKVAALAAEVRRRHPGADVAFVVGLSGERDAVTVLGPLLPLAAAVVVVTPPYRGRPAEQVAAELREAAPDLVVEVAADPQQAVAAARELAGGPVVVTGSTYAVDAVLNPDPYLRHLNATMGWRYDNPVYEPGRGPGR